MEPNGYQFPQIVISSGERLVLPDGNAFGVVLSGERQVWLDGGARSKHAPRMDPSKPWMALPLGVFALCTSSLRPFHRFLRPAKRNLSPADTYPIYQERTSVRRPGRVFCGSKIWKGR